MHGKKSFLALSTAFAALFVGCEWTGSSESDSWSSAYDAMNFSGTYRAVTTATQLSDSEENTTEVTDTSFASVSGEKGGTFSAGAKVMSGSTGFSNIVPGSFQASSSGGFVWNDNGEGKLIFTDPNSGASGGEDTAEFVNVKNETVGTVSSKNQKFALAGNTITPGSVKVQAGSYVLSDDGATHLTMDNGSNSASGKVDYSAGTITLTFSGAYPNGTAVNVSYQWEKRKDQSTQSEDLSGSGTILYQSGAWSLQIKPAMASSQTITISYSYYLKDSTKTSTYTTISKSTGTDVSALTVSQNGQNLTITLDNGIVMNGKFTNVQQTGKVNQDTNAGYNTYNAQFQVASTDTKLVGSLNYDLKNGYRMLNGTWTWGKNTYDVQAVGPAWLNSADASTLSPGVLTK